MNTYYNRDRDIIGFDLGHGESSLSITTDSTSSEPQSLQINGSSNFISAVAETSDGEVLIGDDARLYPDSKKLFIEFKSPELDNPDIRHPIKLFANKIIEVLVESKLLSSLDQTLFVVGCPSGWDNITINKYQALLLETKIKNIYLISESRAAFLCASEVGSLKIDNSLLADSVLIVDMGSSTTDFTSVIKSKEKYLNFGHNKLGAGIIDNLIFNKVLSEHKDSGRLKNLFEIYPIYKTRCIIKSREVKERYFNSSMKKKISIGDTVRIEDDDGAFIHFDIDISEKFMSEILNTPIPSLGGMSWPEAFEASLIMARDNMKDTPPQLVLLTGGASRMDFVIEICERIFPGPKTIVKRGAEPEYTISRGLALAGRIDRKALLFKEEVKKLLSSGSVEGVIKDNIGSLVSKIAPIILDEIIEAGIIPAIKDWKDKKIGTLNQLEDLAPSYAEEHMDKSRLTSKLAAPLIEWFDSIRPDIENLTDPICKAYNIPTTALSLPQCRINYRAQINGKLINTDNLIQFDDLATIINIIASIIVGIVSGGAGLALIMSGPIGIILGIIGGLFIMFYGYSKTKEWLRGANLPKAFRKFVSDNRINKEIQENKPQILASISESFAPENDNYKSLIKGILEPIEKQLMEQAEKAQKILK